MSQARLALGPELAFLFSLLPQDLLFAAPRGSALRDWHDFLADSLSSLPVPLASCRAWAVQGLRVLLHRGMSLQS